MGGAATFFKKFFEQFAWESDASSYMWIIVLMGVIGIAIAVERGYYILVRSNVDAPKFMSEIRKLVASGNIRRAIELCEKGKDKALPYVVLGGLKSAVECDKLDSLRKY